MVINVIPKDEMILTDTELDLDEIEHEDPIKPSQPLEPISLRLPDSICGDRLDKVLSKLVSQYSRGRLQQWIEEKERTGEQGWRQGTHGHDISSSNSV